MLQSTGAASVIVGYPLDTVKVQSPCLPLPLGKSPGVSLPLGVPAVSDAYSAGQVLCQPMGVWCQEACFGMALPSLLDSDFVFVNVSSLPPDSPEVCVCVGGAGGQGTGECPPVRPCEAKEPGKASSVRWQLSPTLRWGLR